jgi:hypothetical protein
MEGEEASPKRRKIDSSDDNTNTNTEIKMNEAHLAAFKEHGLNDADGAPVEVGPIAPLDADSRQRYVRGAERCPANLEQLAVLENADVAAYKVTSSSSDSGSVDYVATVDAAGGGAPTMLCCDDGVSYDTLSPLQLVEYTFSEDVANPENWLVSCLGMESLDSYKGSKFSFWTRNMATAFDGCAAAFLPEVRRGHALCHMYVLLYLNDDVVVARCELIIDFVSLSPFCAVREYKTYMQVRRRHLRLRPRGAGGVADGAPQDRQDDQHPPPRARHARVGRIHAGLRAHFPRAARRALAGAAGRALGGLLGRAAGGTEPQVRARVYRRLPDHGQGCSQREVFLRECSFVAFF